MSLSYKSHVKHNRAYLTTRSYRMHRAPKHTISSPMKTKSGNGSAVAIFLATFSLCLWGGGVFVAKWKIDAMQANLELLSSMARTTNCATENLASGSSATSRVVAAIPRTEDSFLIFHSPLFSMNRLD